MLLGPFGQRAFNAVGLALAREINRRPPHGQADFSCSVRGTEGTSAKLGWVSNKKVEQANGPFRAADSQSENVGLIPLKLN